MDDFPKLAFDHFHSEMDVVLGAPWSFSAAILVIAAIEFFVIWSWQQERFQAQNARIEFLTHKLARLESIPREMADEAGAHKNSRAQEVAPTSLSPVEHAVVSSQPSAANVIAFRTYSEIAPRRLDEPDEGHEPHIQENSASEFIPQQAIAELPAQTLHAELESLANASAPRLDLSVLNVFEGNRVSAIVEVEVLATIATERLQTWVFSASSRQWVPQQPFWRNRGVLIASCCFGDELSRPGDEFLLIIIDTQKCLSGPLATLPRDCPQTKPLTLSRA